MKYIINFCRIIVGALFVFSGAIKANDPMGTAYKLQEYFTVFHVDFINPITPYLSIFFCGLEIALGFAILLGSFAIMSTLFLTALIIFFTWLTGYSAITGKVTDCGCFGEFIKLKPLTSFYKDIVLLVLSIVLLLGRNSIQPLFGKKWNTVLFVLLTLASFFLPVWAYNHLPLIDMLAYKKGNNILQQMQLPPGAKTDSIATVLVCKNKKTGELKELDMTTYTKAFAEWEYIDRKDKVIREGDKPPIHDFVINDTHGNNVTDSLLRVGESVIWVVIYDVKEADKGCFTKINLLVKQCDEKKVKIIGITHSPYNETEDLRHEMNLSFPFYFAGDDKFMKTMVRSNPGIMVVKNGTVMGKWHYNDVPTLSEALK